MGHEREGRQRAVIKNESVEYLQSGRGVKQRAPCIAESVVQTLWHPPPTSFPLPAVTQTHEHTRRCVQSSGSVINHFKHTHTYTHTHV